MTRLDGGPLTFSARFVLAGLAVAFALGACGGSSGRHALPGPATTVNSGTTVPIPSTTGTTTVPTSGTTTQTTPQTTGPRTVLSAIGLNVRAQPAKTAAVLATAAQGTVLSVLAHSDQAGGWFQVKGATVTGWISDSSTLTAQGRFGVYTSSAGEFGALYPATWNHAASPPASVVFQAPTGGETIVATTAANVGALGAGRVGYRSSQSEQVVVCGVSSYLNTYIQASAPAAAPGGAAPEQYLAQVRLTLDAQHALGIDANLTDLSQLQTVRDLLNSVTFPFPQCQH